MQEPGRKEESTSVKIRKEVQKTRYVSEKGRFCWRWLKTLAGIF